VDVVDVHGHVLRYDYERDGSVSRISHIGYVFDGDTPRYEIEFAYEPRFDPISDAKPGVLLRWSERLAEIQVVARGEQLRRYELAYEDEGTSGGLSRLSLVRWFGVGDEGPYPIQFRFEYSAGLGASEPEIVEMSGSLGLDLRTGAADFVDLNSDGLPDVVDTSGAEHRIFLNERPVSGAHRFAVPVDSAVGTLSLVPVATEMFDLDGDGRSDMVDATNRFVLWNRGASDWDAEDQLTTLDMPSLGDDANLRFFDYDNDRRTDLLHADRTASWVHVNRGNGSFVLIDTDVDAIGASFVEDNLQLADLNGDGLQDVVRKATDLVAYRTNLGLGRFSDWIEMDGIPANLAGDEQLVDLNGDALADLVAVRADAVVFSVNRDGTRFAAQTSLQATAGLPIPERTSEISVRFADMNGSGSTDVVWVDASGRVSYLELFPMRPNLLTRIDNAIGKVIEVAYGSSSDHLRRDGGDWSLRLPHPMLTVDEIVLRDELSGVEQRKIIEYRNGYYDGTEKQYQGFANVTVRVPEDDSVEAGVRTLEYDVGVEDTYRKGLLLREAQASGARELSETLNAFGDCSVAGVPETTPSVRFVCPTSVIQTKKEGRPASEWVTIEERFGYDGYGNRNTTDRLGVTSIGGEGCGVCRDEGSFGTPCGSTCSGDEHYERMEFIAPAGGGPWIIGKPAVAREYPLLDSEVFRERVYYYDGEPFVGLPNGELERGTLTRVSAKRVAVGDEAIEVERYARNSHGAVSETLDADGRLRTFAYDSDGLLLVAERVVLDEDQALEMTVELDPVLDLVVRSTAWMLMVGDASESEERITDYGYDEFARLVAIARPGDALDAPSEEYSYELSAPVSRIVRRARSESGGELDIEDVQCFDGLGRSVQKRTLVGGTRYNVSGFTAFNLLGQAFRQYQPHTGDGANCDVEEPSAVEFATTRYDANGRVSRVVQPDGELYGSPSVVDTEYFPLRTATRDQEDTLSSSSDAPHANTPSVAHVDGLGRTVALDRELEPGEPLRTELLYDETGQLSGIIDAAGNRKTQTRDLLGRVLEVSDPDSGVTRYEYDGDGNVIARTDARQLTVLSRYDGAGRKVAEWEDGNEEATRIEYAYDAPGDCDACSNTEGLLARVSYPLGDDSTERGVDEFGYDARSQPSYVARSFGSTRFEFGSEYDNAGRMTRARYPGDLSVTFTHDPAGRVTSVGDFVPEITYGDRDLVATTLLGNGVSTAYEYDVLDRLSAIDTLAPGDVVVQATRYEHDRVGNVVAASDDGVPSSVPSVNARYRYDSLYRLVEARLDPDRDAEEILSFGYDEIDNISSKTSDREDESPDHVGDYVYGEDGAGPHALTTAGGIEFRYGPAGHLEERGSDRFEWDFLGRLARVLPEDGPEARFAYGPSEDRVKKVERGRTTYYLTPDFEVRDGAAVLYVRVGRQRVAKVEVPSFASEVLPDLAPATLDGDFVEPDPDGEITAGDAWIAQAIVDEVFEADTEIRDAVVDELLAASLRRLLGDPLPDGSMISYFHYDHLGSPVAVTGADGELVERRSSYPYGLDRSGEQPVEVDYSFTGMERDEESGLVYFGARYYAPETGRWISADPGFETLLKSDATDNREAWNRYLYALDNPLARVDPDGFESKGGGRYEVFFFDSGQPPADKSKSGTSYGAEIYIRNLETGQVTGPYRGSTYPDSGDKGPDGKKLPYSGNMLSEGTHEFNNKFGHKGSTKPGLNIVDDKGERFAPGKHVATGKDAVVQYGNVHSGFSDKGNYNSRGSRACLTILPKDSKRFFANFDWNKSGVTGTSQGEITIYRGTSVTAAIQRTVLRAQQWLQK
jgi:RHS repeat-associated protein